MVDMRQLDDVLFHSDHVHRPDIQYRGSEEILLMENGKSGSMALMKTQMTGLTIALLFLGTAVCFADDPQMGTWKLNEAKSKFAPGVPKSHTVIYETAGDNVKIIVDGTDKDGKSTHNEWTGKFDGKDYPVTGDPTSDMRSYQKVGDRVLKMTIKKDGKVTVTGRIVVSAASTSRLPPRIPSPLVHARRNLKQFRKPFAIHLV